MAKPVNPSMHAIKTPEGNLRMSKSVYKVLNGGLTYGVPTGDKDSTGCFSDFTNDNIDNVIYRIGGNGTTNGQYQFDATGAVTINHGLFRQPIGFKILDKDQACDVYRTSTPDENFISLKCTVATANVTVEIF